MVQVTVNDKTYTMDGWLKGILDKAKEVIKDDWDMIFCVDGFEGCLTGDTEIQISRASLSRRYNLKRLYNHYNNNPDGVIKSKKNFNLSIPSFVRSFNGKEIRLHKLKDVMYSGKKQVYLLELEGGHKIKATATHKFLTRDGWKPLSELRQGINIMCDTLHAQKSKRKTLKLYDVQLKMDYHPFRSKADRVEVHRLIYEARLNNISFISFVDILLNEELQAKKLKYVNPKIYNIHHKDGCHYNNAIENLERIKKKDHLKYHGLNDYQNFSQGVPVFVKIKTITKLGIEDTYDIECEDPHHNFVANGIVVHNSGKSVLAQQMAFYCDPSFNIDRIVFNSENFTKAILKAKKYQAVVFDEAFGSLSARQAMFFVNQTLVQLLAEIRQKNLFVFIVLPCFFELDKYAAIWRSRALFHVYTTKDFERGRFAYYNKDAKKALYMAGKKFYSYKFPSPGFVAKFPNFYPLDEKQYRAKKHKEVIMSNQQQTGAMLKRYVARYKSLILSLRDIDMGYDEISEGSNKYNRNFQILSSAVKKIASDARNSLKKQGFETSEGE